MDFIIDRRYWRCGGIGPHAYGEGDTMLLNYRGYSDVVGQIMLQMGFLKDQVRGHKVPNALFLEVPGIVEKDENGIPKYSSWCRKLMLLNDDPNITQERREELLTDLIESKGHTVVFQGSLRSKPVPKNAQNPEDQEVP